MRRLVAVALVLVTTPALADQDGPAGPTAPKTVRAALDGATAVFSLHYLVDAAGPNLDRDLASLQLPRDGSVTGAVVTVDGAVHRLALDPAQHATDVFEQIANLAAGASRRWVVHVANGRMPDAVDVEVAAPHSARLMIDLEVSAPTCFVDDVRYVAVPHAWEPVTPRALRRARRDLDTRCGDPDAEGEHVWLGFTSREVAGKPFGDQRLGMVAGRLDLPSDQIAHVEVALAKQISEVPPDLATVFVVDGSASMTGIQSDAQRAIILSYVKLAPRGRVQIVEFDRKAHALLPSWMPASTAMPRITRELSALPANNGSNVDAGIAEAAKWLARIDGTRRMVVFTDELVPERLDAIDAATLRTGLPDGTLVHVVALDNNFGTIERADDVKLASLAVTTEGLSVQGRADDNGVTDALVLVRPLAFEHVTISTPGWTTFSASTAARTCHFDQPAIFAEGVSCEWWGHGETNAGPIKLEGVVWNHKVVRVLRPDPSAGRTLARELGKLGTDLEDAVRAEIDQAAFAVNSVWSMIGTWGGAGGYADLNLALGGFGMSGCGCGDSGSPDSIGFGRIGHLSSKLDLKTQLERGIEKCKRDTAHVEIDLELTKDEIVDVAVTTADRALHDCVVEAVWDTTIVIGNPNAHSHVVVALD